MSQNTLAILKDALLSLLSVVYYLDIYVARLRNETCTCKLSWKTPRGYDIIGFSSSNSVIFLLV